jgi:hypothetical protein
MSANVFSDPFIIRPPSDLLKCYPELKQAANSLALKYAFHELVTDDELRAIGKRLWKALAVDDAFEQARRKAGRQISRLYPLSFYPRPCRGERTSGSRPFAGASFHLTAR